MSQFDLQAKNKNSLFDKLSPLQPYPYQTSFSEIKINQNKNEIVNKIANEESKEKYILEIIDKAKEYPQTDL